MSLPTHLCRCVEGKISYGPNMLCICGLPRPCISTIVTVCDAEGATISMLLTGSETSISLIGGSI